MTRPDVIVIGTGGTISCFASDPLDVLDYPEFNTKLDAADLVARLPDGLAREVEVSAVPFSRVNSTEIGHAEWVGLARLIARLIAERDPAGIVVTHGTATAEETAYALNLVLRTDRPVVLTAAQRPAGAVSADGPMNLVAAIRTAAAPQARGLGVLLVANDEIHAARHVTKASTYRLNTFVSPEAGPLGTVDGDGPQLGFAPATRHTTASLFTTADLEAAPRVDIAYAHAGADGTAVRAFVAAGAAGVVSAGLLPGIVPASERAALRRAADEGCVVVQSTRGASGRVARRRFLREAGWVAAGSLNPAKARILLGLSLVRTRDVAEIQSIFDTH